MRTISALIAATALTLNALATFALAVPTHLHCLDTPGATVAIASGLTENGPHDAFHQFHFNVHLGAFATNSASSPVTISTTTPDGSCE